MGKIKNWKRSTKIRNVKRVYGNYWVNEKEKEIANVVTDSSGRWFFSVFEAKKDNDGNWLLTNIKSQYNKRFDTKKQAIAYAVEYMRFYE